MFRECLGAKIDNEKGFKLTFDVETTRQAQVKMRKGTTHILIMEIEQIMGRQLHCIRELKLKYPELKIIVLTGYCSHASLLLLQGADVNGMILKNNGFKHLLFGINKVIEWGSYFDGLDLQQHVALNKADAKQLADWYAVILTPREHEIIILLCKELTNQQIATKLHIELTTAISHRNNIMKKTESVNFAGLLLFAINMRIIAILNNDIVKISIPDSCVSHTHRHFATFVYHLS